MRPNATYFFVGRPPWAAAGGALWALVGLAGSPKGPEEAGQGASRGAGAPPHIVARLNRMQKDGGPVTPRSVE